MTLTGLKIKGKGQMGIETKPFLGELIASPKENQRWENSCSTCQCACFALSIAYILSTSDSNAFNFRITRNCEKTFFFFFAGHHIAEIVSSPFNQYWVRVLRGGNVSSCCSVVVERIALPTTGQIKQAHL